MGKQDEGVEKKFETVDNYVAKMPTGSKSAKAATAGDKAGSVGAASQFRLPAIELSAEHAFERESELREQAEGYHRARHTDGTAAYRNMSDQAAGYQADALAIQLASQAYNQLVPHAAFALDSVIRFKAIQTALGPQFDDVGGQTSLAKRLTTSVRDHAPALERGASTSSLDTMQGHVTDAARIFQSAESELQSAYSNVQNVSLRHVIATLQAEKTEKEEEREKIKQSIEAAHSLVEGIGAVLSAGSEGAIAPRKLHGHEELERTEGKLGIAGLGVEAAGQVLSAGMYMLNDAKLAKLNAEISALVQRLKSTAALALAGELATAYGQLETKRDTYATALSAYEHAIANQRTVYAKAGAAADTAHGGDLKHGGDKASQTMLFISAARETKVILTTALTPGRAAEEHLHEALHSMNSHRIKSYQVDDWESEAGEGTSAPDQVAVENAYGLTMKWVKGTEEEQAAFAGIDQDAAAMLATTAKVKGAY